MNETYQKLKADVEEKMAPLLAEIKNLQQALNAAATIYGEAVPYPKLIENEQSTGSIHPDDFFGSSLAGAVKKFLRMKGRSASAEEILEALERGGYEFPEEWKKKDYLKNVAISLSKNRYDLVYLKSNKTFGLPEFYPELSSTRAKNKKKIDEVEEDGEAQTAKIKILITRADEKQLSELGYSQSEIDAMKPERAGEIIDKKIRNGQS